MHQTINHARTLPGGNHAEVAGHLPPIEFFAIDLRFAIRIINRNRNQIAQFVRVGFWQNGFFADLFWAAEFFFRRKIPGKILQILYIKILGTFLRRGQNLEHLPCSSFLAFVFLSSFLPLEAPYRAILREYLNDAPLLRAMGFLVSQHCQLGAIPPPPFLSVPLKEHAKWRCDTPPPPTKGYLSDTCAIPYDNKGNACDPPL